MKKMLTNISSDGLRFVIAGLVNTGLTTAIYIGLLKSVGPTVAYAIAWIGGIMFVFVVYPNKVFVGGRSGFIDRFKLSVSTIAIFLAGVSMLNFLVVVTESAILSFCLTLVFTTLANFILGRVILRS
ncbi:hypothetical protein N8E89_19340 (plasmid) [Phyllobacterium sp. A18/5-2]|uniref:GtrA family protein n=1 Tax=Phyllobacterium sp. A18/5-2 TaxID=2978392 RepID=UPI0021C81948|nr:GtrA family protein [Phyllobacterium sp. A18/5-2]UXN66764.1 hypothetical protein N8E89_19340 [Phyllobacterium sp. A18/5-2]